MSNYNEALHHEDHHETIERLREQLKYEVENRNEQIERLRAENEVLREANQRQDAERIGVMNQRNQAWEEVERLRKELNGKDKSLDEVRDAFKAEVERLRAICGLCAQGTCQYHDVERLRAALKDTDSYPPDGRRAKHIARQALEEK